MPATLSDLTDPALPVLRAHGVVRAGVFGSYAKSTQIAESDLDLVVEFESGRSLLDLVALQFALASTLGLEVDVVTYSSLHPMLADEILASERRIL